MGHPPRQLPDGLHLLGLQKLGLELFPILLGALPCGDINGHEKHTSLSVDFNGRHGTEGFDGGAVPPVEGEFEEMDGPR